MLILTINRPEKRNALNVPTVEGIGTVFAELPESIRAVVIHGAGDHFSAGLDLTELQTLTAAQGMHHSRRWHRIF
ncbi:MAG: enoyl-CoA hydratase-related protein, partial [Burkholderiales bacterium]